MPRAIAGFVLLLAVAAARAEDWPAFRGPTGQGQSAEMDLPLRWGGKDNANVLWKVPLQNVGQSSPIVRGERVFVATVFWPAGASQKDTFPEHHLLCFRASDGRKLWDRSIEPGTWKLTDLRGGYGAPTPAADGERVYVLFGSAVLAAVDFDGKLVWRKELPKPYAFDVAIAGSPVLYQDTVLLLCDETNKASRLLAYDKRTGELKWDRKRPEADFAHSTPVLVEVGGKPQLLVSSANELQGLDPSDGRIVWRCKTAGDVTSPVLAGGLVYCDKGRGGPGIAVDPTGTGDVTRTHVKWKLPQVPEGFSSPVAVGPYLYRVHNPGVLKCWKIADGTQVYSERLNGVSTAASPFATADGRLYVASAGKSYVVKAGPTFEVLAVNDLGDGSQASAAVSGGRIFLKGQRFLYGIGKK